MKWKISNPIYESDELNDNLKVSPWNGHRNFIYDYIRNIRPKHIIELGTHYGCSFFAMSQAIKDDDLSTELIGVDTWKGDPQAGFYGEEVWDTVNKTIDKYFNNINLKLMRTTFDEASLEFDDDFFDVIHIDGYHTYESVSNDFTHWLPKLKKDGMIIFHDVDSKLGYGSNDFWNEIKHKYTCTMEFTHSWGLGILFPKGDAIYKELIENNNFEDKLSIYYYKALYQYGQIEIHDLKAMADDRYMAINHQSKMIDERDAEIKAMKIMIEERYAAILEQSKMIDERDMTIKNMEEIIENQKVEISRLRPKW